MYKKSTDQLAFVDFHLPFEGKLSADNRWVKLASLIPWREVEEIYAKNFSQDGQGAPAKSVRIAFGSLIIKEKLGTSDEETVEQIRENPYLQYFLGLPGYRDEAPFDSSMFVHFRKRFDGDTVAIINERIVQLAMQKKSTDKDSDDNDNPSAKKDRGKLIIDATCVPSDISFPTDLNLLNKAREKLEDIVDTLHSTRKPGLKKPRTYLKKARRDYLSCAKRRRQSAKQRRKGVRKQLNYVRRNLHYIEALVGEVSLSPLSRRQYRDLLVIQELYRQQQAMHDQSVNRTDDRIVSISQPYIRPIVRGKAKSPTEFGAKISVSVVNGFTFVDHLNWNAYNEAGDLASQVENYKRRFGFYPASVHADKIYRTRANLVYCRDREIRLSGPPLGRPPKALTDDPALLKANRKQRYRDEIDRIEIEGKFGLAKRRYGLDRIMTKLASTSECVIVTTFLVMNLMKLLVYFFVSFKIQLFCELRQYFTPIYAYMKECEAIFTLKYCSNES